MADETDEADGAVEGRALSAVELSAVQERQALEDEYLEAMWGPVSAFLRGLVDAAVQAYGAPVVVVASADDGADGSASPVSSAPRPLAWTRVRADWYAAIRKIARYGGWMADPTMQALLESSMLPVDAFEDVRGILAQASAEGWSEWKLKRALSARMIPRRLKGELVGPYAARIRTAAATAATANAGRRAVLAAREGGASHKRWVSRHDSKVRPGHAAADGQVVPVDAVFDVDGEYLRFPGDPQGSPGNVINCRCVVVPVDKSEAAAAVTASVGVSGEGTEKMATSVGARALTVFEDAGRSDGAETCRWAGVLAVEGVMTGDGRYIEEGALRWETLPVPLRAVRQDVGGHDGAEVCGRIDSVERRDGGVVWGEGVFDLGSEIGAEAARQVVAQMSTGVSIDTDDVVFEVHLKADLLAAEMPDEDEPLEDGLDGMKVLGEYAPDDEVMVIKSARLRAATLVATPAFEQARVQVVGDVPAPAAGGSDAPKGDVGAAAAAADADVLTAAAIPVAPPAAWFDPPALSGPTALTVSEDGRVFGHIAAWGTCHIGQVGECVQPPSSPSGYAYFRTGAVRTAEGVEVAVGHLTMGTGHAAPRAGARAAAEHYDNTGTVFADVAAGEDAWGIWVAGALRPGTTPEQVRAARSAPISGDWRRIGGSLELVGALAVNVPGFPVPRPTGLVASGVVESLTASGIVAQDGAVTAAAVAGQPPADPADVGEWLTVGDLAYLKRVAQTERRREAERMATARSTAERVDRVLAAARVRRMALRVRTL